VLVLSSTLLPRARRNVSLSIIGALTTALIVAQAPPGLAEESVPVTTLTISGDGFEESDATLVIALDQPIDAAEVDDALSEMGVDPATLSIVGENATVVDDTAQLVAGRRPPPPARGNQPGGDVSATAGPTGQDLYCWASYGWGDSNGRFTLQHACGGSTAPWGYKFSLTLRNIVTGYVYEHGMWYSVNGVGMGRGNPHYVPDDYQFHGTFSRTYDYTRVRYDDYFTFRVNVGGRLGDGALSIAGSFRFIR
jgi:hypothetical protein